MENSAPALTLATPINYARGVGPVRAGHFAALEGGGIRTCGDLLNFFPRDYLRMAGEKPVPELRTAELATVRGTIIQTRIIRKRPARFEALLDDESADGRCVLTWFHMHGLEDKIVPGTLLRATGKVTAFKGRPQLVNPHFEILEQPAGDVGRANAPPRTAGIEPVYPASSDLSSPVIARIIAANLDALLPQIGEWFPEPHLRERHLFTRRDAVVKAHRPASLEEAQRARRTLAYHEFFLHQAAVAIKRHHLRTAQPAIPLRTDDAVDRRIRALLDFPLTAAQDRVITAIRKDLASTKPMNRLLQGDVGSGKTVVALYAMLCAVATPRANGVAPKSAGPSGSFSGHQAALMAPTEILAKQHFLTLSEYLAGKKVKLGLLVGGQPAAERNATLRALADGPEAGGLGLVIGTHALLTESVQFKSLALIIIDEQHKFGVEHRSILRSRKAGTAGAPHTLVMTATPIPRTLAMTAFGDLDVSTIDELPPGRHPIHTKMTIASNRDQVYAFVATRLKAGEQAYVVVPTIDEGELDLRSATATQEELQKGWLKDYRIGLIHGRQSRQTRQAIMERFRQKLLDVLVATTVIEVGVDVPNATVMVIEHADRFGLSQLHQLRGRVGRSTKKSFCILISDQTTEEGIKRIDAMVRHSSGFKLSEEDLKLRGMGQIIGTAQSGRTDMHFPDLLFDSTLLPLARRDAFQVIAADPRLLDPTHHSLRQEVLTKFGDSITLADVG